MLPDPFVPTGSARITNHLLVGQQPHELSPIRAPRALRCALPAGSEAASPGHHKYRLPKTQRAVPTSCTEQQLLPFSAFLASFQTPVPIFDLFWGEGTLLSWWFSDHPCHPCGCRESLPRGRAARRSGDGLCGSLMLGNPPRNQNPLGTSTGNTET